MCKDALWIRTETISGACSCHQAWLQEGIWTHWCGSKLNSKPCFWGRRMMEKLLVLQGDTASSQNQQCPLVADMKQRPCRDLEKQLKHVVLYLCHQGIPHVKLLAWLQRQGLGKRYFQAIKTWKKWSDRQLLVTFSAAGSAFKDRILWDDSPSERLVDLLITAVWCDRLHQGFPQKRSRKLAKPDLSVGGDAICPSQEFLLLSFLRFSVI